MSDIYDLQDPEALPAEEVATLAERHDAVVRRLIDSNPDGKQHEFGVADGVFTFRGGVDQLDVTGPDARDILQRAIDEEMSTLVWVARADSSRFGGESG